MRQGFAALLAAIVMANAAQAGPWLRAAGDGYLSFSTETPVSEDGPVYVTTYLEYGLTDKVTLGFDLGGSEDELYKAVAFAKIALVNTDSPLKISAELGLGTTEDEAVLRPGLSIGRGFTMGEVSGWMTIDTLAYFELENSDVELTTDITVGFNTSERSKFLVQLQSGDHLMDPDYLKLAPSYVFERKPGQHIELGVLAGIENAADLALKLGLWQEF